MINKRIAKITGLAVGMSLALGASSAGAQTIAELQAQINALLAQLAALQGGSVSTGAPACTFTRSLTIGSRGADVTCLQNYLTSTGHFTYAGGATGYFGPITRSAVAAWQAANGVAPAVGYFGPISTAKYNAIAPTTGGGTTTTGGGGTTTTGGGGITTPGVEGTITATLNPSPASGTKVYENGSQVAVMGLKLEADLSDIRVERVKMQLSAGTSGNSDQQFYTKIASRMYVMDGSSVLASTDLNASTVVKEGSSYYITIAGFSFVVPKDTTRVLTIAIDPKSSWDTTYDGDSWTMTVPANGVRAVDGAGINQYSPTAALSGHSFTSAADIVDSAALSLSRSADSPDPSQVIASQGSSDNEYDDLVLLIADFKADKDQVKVTDLIVDIVRGGGNNVATATTAYVYDGSTLLGSAVVAGTSATAMSATFNNIDWIIPANTTKKLTVKVDIDSAALATDTFTADIGSTSAVATNVTSENSVGDSITETGSAVGSAITIRNVGPELTLVSKSITTDGVPQSSASNNLSTSTLTATFNLKIKAVGGDIVLGTVASGTPVMASTTQTGLTGGSFLVYKNGASDTTLSSNATSTSYVIPSACVVGALTNSCTLSENSEVVIPAVFQVEGRQAASTVFGGGLYSVQFAGITWQRGGAAQQTTFMSSDNDWRTADVSFP